MPARQPVSDLTAHLRVGRGDIKDDAGLVLHRHHFQNLRGRLQLLKSDKFRRRRRFDL